MSSDFSAWRSIQNLLRLRWWREAIALVFAIAPSCIYPALFCTLSNAIVIGSSAYSQFRLSANPVELSDMLVAAAALFGGGVSGICLLLFGFNSWLDRLIALSILVVGAPSLTELVDLSKDERAKLFERAFSFAKSRKLHVGAVLLWVSLYMVIPFFMLVSCIVLKIITLPKFSGSAAIKLGPWVDFVSFGLGVPILLFLMVYSYVSLIVAACAIQKAQKAANLAFSYSVKYILPIGVVALVFTLLGSIAGVPNDIRQIFMMETLFGYSNTALKIGMQFWQGAVSVIMFPLSFIPVCEILRHHLRDDALALIKDIQPAIFNQKSAQL